MRNLIHSLARWLYRKTMPPSLAVPWSGNGSLDAFGRRRAPTSHELLAELKGTAWTCASLNASVCANHPPRLYVATHPGQPAAKALTRPLGRPEEERLRAQKSLPPRQARARKIEEVLEHPLLDLLRQVNPIHNGFDLWELTQLYLEVHGRAFWYLHFHPVLKIPEEIWILPAQGVTPRRQADSGNPIDWYEYGSGSAGQRFSPEEILFFRFPDPRDPYLGGLSPLRACFEQVALASDFAETKKAVIENQAIPSAVIAPAEVIGENERARLESQWNQKFRRGGAGRVLVAETNLKVQLLQHSLGDLAALAEMKATKEDIANAFHVPLSFLTSETNLANLQAAEHQHLSQAIAPRLTRRDQKLNEQLIPLYDPTGRLFLASDDPVPANGELLLRERALDLKYGVVTINEVRSQRGLPPL
jgi:HK97 family phage portal protein